MSVQPTATKMTVLQQRYIAWFPGLAQGPVAALKVIECHPCELAVALF